MKHDLKITLILVIFFVLAQVVGLALVSENIKGVGVKDGETKIIHEPTLLGERPDFEKPAKALSDKTGIDKGQAKGFLAFLYLGLGIFLGTVLVLWIIRMRKIKLWKIWFFLAVFISIILALGIFAIKYFTPVYIIFIIALILSILKVIKPNIVIHNVTEILMYAGIGVLLIPIINVTWAFIILIAISIYDFIAVLKSKHMVKMAKFQTKSKVFAGLFIPYTQKAKTKSISLKASKMSAPKKLPKSFKTKKEKVQKKNAILGGGDIAFPLLFTGVVMESLVIQGFPKISALYQSLIITLTTTIALGLLFIFAKKDKFYPAMPFISAGCFLGYLIIILL